MAKDNAKKKTRRVRKEAKLRIFVAVKSRRLICSALGIYITLGGNKLFRIVSKIDDADIVIGSKKTPGYNTDEHLLIKKSEFIEGMKFLSLLNVLFSGEQKKGKKKD